MHYSVSKSKKRVAKTRRTRKKQADLPDAEDRGFTQRNRQDGQASTLGSTVADRRSRRDFDDVSTMSRYVATVIPDSRAFVLLNTVLIPQLRLGFMF